MGSDIGAPRAKLEARYLGQGADDEGEAGILAAAPARPRRTSSSPEQRRPISSCATWPLWAIDCGDELDHGLATLSEEPAEYWSARAALAWN